MMLLDTPFYPLNFFWAPFSHKGYPILLDKDNFNCREKNKKITKSGGFLID